jgi:hypothetical protein
MMRNFESCAVWSYFIHALVNTFQIFAILISCNMLYPLMIDWKFIIAEVRRQLTSIELVKPFFSMLYSVWRGTCSFYSSSHTKNLCYSIMRLIPLILIFIAICLWTLSQNGILLFTNSIRLAMKTTCTQSLNLK